MGLLLNSAVSSFNYLKTENGVFHILFILTIFVNKYVLSILGFSYPTVYQGWQTLVGAFILLYLRPNLFNSNEESSKLTYWNFLKILPHLLIYVALLICGSKTLAIIPVPLYVCAQNTSAICLLLTTLKHVTLYDCLIALTGLFSSLILFIYIGFIDPYGYHPWPIFFILASTVHELINETLESSKEISGLYYRNIFSFVILMPCSLYLGEAFSALQFKYLYQIGFYAGCIARHGTMTVARIEKVWPCRNFRAGKVNVTYIKLEEVGRLVTFANLNISIGADAPPKLVIRAVIRKCKSIKDERCEHYFKATMDLCSMFEDRDNWYSGMFNFQPSFHCPVKKGMYSLRNGTFDADRMLAFIGGFFPPEYFDYHWLWRLYIGKKPATDYFCINIFVKLYSVKE